MSGIGGLFLVVKQILKMLVYASTSFSSELVDELYISATPTINLNICSRGQANEFRGIQKERKIT